MWDAFRVAHPVASLACTAQCAKALPPQLQPPVHKEPDRPFASSIAFLCRPISHRCKIHMLASKCSDCRAQGTVLRCRPQGSPATGRLPSAPSFLEAAAWAAAETERILSSLHLPSSDLAAHMSKALGILRQPRESHPSRPTTSCPHRAPAVGNRSRGAAAYAAWPRVVSHNAASFMADSRST